MNNTTTCEMERVEDNAFRVALQMAKSGQDVVGEILLRTLMESLWLWRQYVESMKLNVWHIRWRSC